MGRLAEVNYSSFGWLLNTMFELGREQGHRDCEAKLAEFNWSKGVD